MLTEIEGNLLDIEEGVVCQQVNCRGVMGSGLALAIRNKYPEVYTNYRERYERCRAGDHYELGDAHVISVSPTLFVANLYGQDGYGTGVKQTNYGALSQALFYLKVGGYTQVHIPYLLGCGLGGGDWAVVSELIEFYIPEAIIVRLPEASNG